MERGELVAIKKVGRLVLVTEEQPSPSARLGRMTVPQERAKGSNPRTRSDHDDRRIGIRGQTKGVRLLQVDFDARAGGKPIGEAGRGHAKTLATGDVVAHRIDGQMDLCR